jgi:hypothetical protein
MQNHKLNDAVPAAASIPNPANNQPVEKPEPSPPPAEIYDEEHLSSRFWLYQRDGSQKGRALYLSQLLQHLKRVFPEHKELLDQTMTKVRVSGSSSDEEKVKLILKAMRHHSCSTVEEIAEETDLSTVDVRSILNLMVKQKIARKMESPVAETYRDNLYFLN